MSRRRLTGRIAFVLTLVLLCCAFSNGFLTERDIQVKDPTVEVTHSERTVATTRTVPVNLPVRKIRLRSQVQDKMVLLTQDKLRQVGDAVGIERLSQILEMLAKDDDRGFQRSFTVHHGRSLKLLSAIPDALDTLNLGNLWSNRPRLLEMPDLAVGVEGLFGTLARTTLASLANQAAGQFLPSGSTTSATPQTKGVQRQYQLQFTRGPWNVQSGLQIGVQAEGDQSGTFFLNPNTAASPSVQDPQTVFQQASDVYYGQAFNEGYGQGYTHGTQSTTMGVPTGSLPPLPPNSPTGFNEGIVAGFTRGLQDGYFAGFQSAQTGASQRGGISPPTALAANPGGLSQTSLPHALPHVSSGGPLPRNLLEAQRKAVLDYTSELKERIEQLERRSRPSIIPPGVDTPTTRSEIDQSGETAQIERDPVQLRGNEILEPAVEPREEEDASEDNMITIAGLNFYLATLIFSGVLFFVVLLCCLCYGAWPSQSKPENVAANVKTKGLKSKTSDAIHVSAYMKSASMFDDYISTQPPPASVNRSAGAKQ